DAFLVAVGRPGHVAAGHGAADVRPVGEVDGERDEPVSREDGTDRLHVRQVIPADLREVEEPDVALAQPRRWDPLEELLDRERHRARGSEGGALIERQPDFANPGEPGLLSPGLLVAARRLEERQLDSRVPYAGHHAQVHALDALAGGVAVELPMARLEGPAE